MSFLKRLFGGNKPPSLPNQPQKPGETAAKLTLPAQKQLPTNRVPSPTPKAELNSQAVPTLICSGCGKTYRIGDDAVAVSMEYGMSLAAGAVILTDGATPEREDLISSLEGVSSDNLGAARTRAKQSWEFIEKSLGRGERRRWSCNVCKKVNSYSLANTAPAVLSASQSNSSPITTPSTGTAKVCRREEHVWTGCVCSRCGEIRDESHEWQGGVCTKCGALQAGFDARVASRTGDLNRLKEVLTASPEAVWAKNQTGFTPLHIAAICNHKQAAALLLVHGADVNARADSGVTPLLVAASFRESPDHSRADMVKLLLDYKADPLAKDNEGWTPLSFAASGGPYLGMDKEAARLMLESIYTEDLVAFLRDDSGPAKRLGPALDRCFGTPEKWMTLLRSQAQAESINKTLDLTTPPLVSNLSDLSASESNSSPIPTPSTGTAKKTRLLERQLVLRDEMLGLPVPSDISDHERELALGSNSLAKLMALEPAAENGKDILKFIQTMEKISMDKKRLRIFTEMFENYMRATRDPLNFFTAEEIDYGADKKKWLEAFFLRMSGTGNLLAAIHLGRREGKLDLVAECEANLRDEYSKNTSEVQAALLTTYYSDGRGKEVAQQYLMEWFKDCDVKGSLAVLEAHLLAATMLHCEYHKEFVGKFQGWESKGFKL